VDNVTCIKNSLTFFNLSFTISHLSIKSPMCLLYLVLDSWFEMTNHSYWGVTNYYTDNVDEWSECVTIQWCTIGDNGQGMDENFFMYKISFRYGMVL